MINRLYQEGLLTCKNYGELVKNYKLGRAARTDKGVHALQNVVSFMVRDERVYERVARRLPVMMPEWLSIHSCRAEQGTFNARFSATGKSYAYVFMKKDSWSPFFARYAYRLSYPVPQSSVSAPASPLT